MMILPHIYTGTNITVYLNGVPKTADQTHANFEKLVEMIRNGQLTVDKSNEILELIDIRESVANQFVDLKEYGRVKVGVDAVMFNDRVVHSFLATRMLEFVKEGIDVGPWARFMDKLYDNPSKTAVDELFLWLEKAQMPITPNGNFLAYKKVDNDYSSFHRDPEGNKVFNRIGEVVEMPRHEVDDNRHNTCSSGLHFCSWHYLPEYYGNRGKVLVLEINPADVVSIPSDYDNAKGRAWRYVVKSEIPEKDARFAFEGVKVHSFEDD